MAVAGVMLVVIPLWGEVLDEQGASPAHAGSVADEESSRRGGTIQACTILKRGPHAREGVMAGRSVANRSEAVTVSTPRGPVEVVRQQWRSQRPGSSWNWEWLARGPVSVTGGRARRPARRSAKRCFWRPASSRSGCWTPSARKRGAGGLVIVRAHRVNYARRQQYRRLSRAGEAGIGAAGTAVLGLWAASVSAALVAVCLLILAAALALCARHWLSLARRSRVGAHSEDVVQRALAPLEAEGWRLRHSLPWQGRGDIDSVAIAPNRDCRRDRDEVRREAPCCIPGSAGRNSKGGSWVQWLTRI